MDKMKPMMTRALEIGLFFAAFAALIPPVPSVDGQVYRLAPALIVGGGALLASLYLGIRRDAENRVTAVLKISFFLIYGWVIHERVWMH